MLTEYVSDINENVITTEELSFPLLKEKNVSLSVLRADKIHPQISGNKWFKLKYYLEDAHRIGKRTIVTFGGAWSNHILATAAACQLQHLSSIGIIRGEEPSTYSSTLLQAKQLGMQFVFISREDYQKKKIPSYLQNENYYIIPEGGYGEMGAAGAATMIKHVETNKYSHICCAVGTGTMLAGLLNLASANNTIIGLSVLKNNIAIEEEVRRLLIDKNKPVTINHAYHFGGYAKHTPELIHFMNEFYLQTKVPTDFVYTAKLFYAVQDLISKNYFSEGCRLLLIHSGGLQGNSSLGKGTLIF
jgi:1-aminocyclopropane-1-carboxylate deaminase